MLHNEAWNLLVEAYEKTHVAKGIAFAYGVVPTVYRLAEQKSKTGSVDLRASERGRKRVLGQDAMGGEKAARVWWILRHETRRNPRPFQIVRAIGGYMGLTQKINRIARLCKKTGKCILQPTASESVVLAFEEEHHLQLPEEYRAFITQVGDGAILLPNGETQELLSLSQASAFISVDKKFPLTESWRFDSGVDFEQENSQDEKVVEEIEKSGHLNLIKDLREGGMWWILILVGNRSGEVWLRDDFGYLMLPNCTFLDWLDLYLNDNLIPLVEKLSKAEREDASEAKHALTTIRALMGSRKRKKIKWNAPISLGEVEIFETQHNIILPKEYLTFITEVANGCKHLPTVNGTIDGGIMFRLEDLKGLSQLAKPFPYQKKSEDIERQLLTAYNMKHTIWESEFLGMPRDTSKVWASAEYSVLCGALPLAVYNDTGDFQDNTEVFLILNGDYRGQICRASRYNISIGGTQKSFYSWMIQTLKYGAL